MARSLRAPALLACLCHQVSRFRDAEIVGSAGIHCHNGYSRLHNRQSERKKIRWERRVFLYGSMRMERRPRDARNVRFISLLALIFTSVRRGSIADAKSASLKKIWLIKGEPNLGYIGMSMKRSSGLINRNIMPRTKISLRSTENDSESDIPNITRCT